MLPVIGVGIYIYSTKRAVQDNAKFLHGRLAELTADTVARSLEQLNRTLTVVEDIERAHGKAALEVPALQHAGVADANVALLSILDDQGVEVQRMADMTMFPVAGFVNRNQDPSVIASRQSGRLTIGAPIELGNTAALPVVHPLPEGRTLYMVYSLRTLQKRLEKLGGGANSRGRILVVDSTGKAIPGIGSPPPDEKWRLPDETQDLEWWERLRGADGPWVAAAAIIPSLQWRAVSMQTRSEAYSETNDEEARAGFALLVMFIVVAISAFGLSALLSSPITILIKGAERVAGGDFSRPVPRLAWQEIDNLARTFNEMTGKIRRYQELQVERIFEEKAKVDALIKNIPEGVLLVGSGGVVDFANSAAIRILGLRSSGLRSNDLPPNLRQLIDSARAGSHRTNDSILVELQVRDSETSNVFACQAAKIVREGKEVGILVLMRDVTVERELERMKEEFFHAVVHDLRGPVSVIDGMVHVMKNLQSLGDRERRYLELAKTATARLSGLIANILDIAKLESGTMMLALAKVPADSILGAVRDLNRVPAEAKGVTIEVETQNPGEISIDAKLVDRVLMNLVGNALKFTPSGGRITIGAIDGGSEVEYYVRDTGPGIPASQVKAIFEKFKQLDRDAAKRAGYGLGLSICKKIVEVHGGHIWVESEEGKGSRFVFRLPRQGPPTT